MSDFDKPAEEAAIYQNRLKKIVSDDLVLYNENSLNAMQKINAGYEVWFNENWRLIVSKNMSFTDFWKDQNTILIGKTIYLDEIWPLNERF